MNVLDYITTGASILGILTFIVSLSIGIVKVTRYVHMELVRSNPNISGFYAAYATIIHDAENIRFIHDVVIENFLIVF